MRIQKDQKLEKAIGTPFDTFHYDAKTRRLVGHTGELAVSILAEHSDGDTTGPVSKEAILASRKQGLEIQLIDKTEQVGGVRFERPTTENRYDLLTAPGGYLDDIEGKVGDPNRVSICLAPALLMAIAQAMGVKPYEGVRLTFDPNGFEIVITHVLEDENFSDYAVLGPFKVTKKRAKQ